MQFEVPNVQYCYKYLLRLMCLTSIFIMIYQRVIRKVPYLQNSIFEPLLYPPVSHLVIVFSNRFALQQRRQGHCKHLRWRALQQ